MPNGSGVTDSIWIILTEKTGEIDFVIQNGMRVNLVEVKSGNDFKVRSAMNRIRKVENWTFGQSSVFCKGNLETDGAVHLNLSVFCVMGRRIPVY